MNILIIDPLFAGRPDVEEATAGPDISFEVAHAEPAALPDNVLARADAVILSRSRWPLTGATAERLTRARVVVQAAVGFNHIDLAGCARRGIPVCNTPDYGTREVADHAIALTLALTRGITTYSERLRRDEPTWGTAALPLPPVRRLGGLTFGVVGLGRIGTATALRAKALDMRVAFFDPHTAPGQELALGVMRCDTLPELLRLADVVSLHCPLTEATRGLIGREAVAAFKPGAVLINTARGPIVDLDALEHGLRTGALAAAGLDVLPTEPPDPATPLLAAWRAREAWLDGRLVLTPHAAFYTPESLADMRRLSTRSAVDFLRHGTLRACVNRAELERNGYGPGGRGSREAG